MNVLSRNCCTLIIASLMLFCSGCNTEVPGGDITIRNDIQDRSYNVIEITASGGRSFRSRLKPGDAVRLPNGTTTISFSRAYAEFTRQYRVECPRGFNRKITVKLIDVHLNRIAGGCKTVWSRE